MGICKMVCLQAQACLLLYIAPSIEILMSEFLYCCFTIHDVMMLKKKKRCFLSDKGSVLKPFKKETEEKGQW